MADSLYNLEILKLRLSKFSLLGYFWLDTWFYELSGYFKFRFGFPGEESCFLEVGFCGYSNYESWFLLVLSKYPSYRAIYDAVKSSFMLNLL
jgi:hypothetical protein